MTDEQVFELAERNSFQDDSGCWIFKDEGLLDFVFMVQKAEREACAKVVEADGLARGDEGLVFIKAASRIRARGIDGAKVGEVGVWGDTAPPKREWVGLTRRELDIATLGLEDLGDCYLAIEAKLKEKNT